MKTVGIVLGLLFAGGLLIAYDMGQRSIVRECHRFHAFTHESSAWSCLPLRNKEEVKASPTGEQI